MNRHFSTSRSVATQIRAARVAVIMASTLLWKRTTHMAGDLM